MKMNANIISEDAKPRKKGKDIEGSFMKMNGKYHETMTTIVKKF
jgi:hypothetical protein